MTKTFVVTFKLKELSASHYYHAVTVSANNVGRAIDLAWKEVKQRPSVKGKRIKKGEVLFEQIVDN